MCPGAGQRPASGLVPKEKSYGRGPRRGGSVLLGRELDVSRSSERVAGEWALLERLCDYLQWK